MLAVGGTRIKLLFTAPNFLKHFVDILEKLLRNDSAIRQSIRGRAFLDHDVFLVCLPGLFICLCLSAILLCNLEVNSTADFNEIW